MNFLLNLLSKLPLAGKLAGLLGAGLKFLQGKKTYTAAAAWMLQGVTMVLGDLESAQTLNDVIDVLKQPEWLKSFSEGLGLLGLRAAKK